MSADRLIRVLVADDHPPIRAGVRLALEAQGFEICAEVADGPAAVRAAIDLRPDICLLDIHMPGNGIVAAGEIAHHVPEAVVVMLTVSRNDDDLFNALRVGASGYLLKDTDPDRLPLALRGVLEGEAAIPRTLAAKVIDEFRERGRRRRLPLIGSRGASLTSREWEVLHLMADGLSTSQLATRLNISQVTVRRHVSSILHKLQVPDRDTAVRLVSQT